jgi:hypothetical protein
MLSLAAQTLSLLLSLFCSLFSCQLAVAVTQRTAFITGNLRSTTKLHAWPVDRTPSTEHCPRQLEARTHTAAVMAGESQLCNWCGKEADPEYDVRALLTHTATRQPASSKLPSREASWLATDISSVYAGLLCFDLQCQLPCPQGKGSSDSTSSSSGSSN